MWVVYPPATGACGRPTKAPKVAEGAPEPRNPAFWIRPGSDYTAGRSDEHDIFLTHPKISRSKTIFTLIASKVDPQETFLAGERNATRPSYELRIRAKDDALIAIDEDQAKVTIKPHSEYIIRDGLSIRAFEYKSKECILIFRWRPVHLYIKAIKKKEIAGLQEALAPLGVTFSAACMANKLPDITHTHAVFAKLLSAPSPPQLIAANYQLQFVQSTWIDKLLAVTQAPPPRPLPPPPAPTAGEEDAEPPKPKRQPAPKSALEIDFDLHWPSEDDFVPPGEGKDSGADEQELWKPNIERRLVFKDTLFLDCSGDPSMSPLVTSAGGIPYAPNLDNLKTCLEYYDRFLEAHGPGGASLKKYVITPLSQELFSQEQLGIIRQLFSPHIDGHVEPLHVFACVKEIRPIGQIKRSVDAATGPAPTPALPGATADISYPATHPGDVAASAPPRPAPAAPQKRPAPAVGEQAGNAVSAVAEDGRPSKKPRKLGARAAVFDNIFASSSSAALLPNAPEVLHGTQASSLGSKTTSNAEVSESQANTQCRSLRPEGKFSKLKRRVGQNNASQGSSLGEPELPQETEEPPSKKFKSFDPDVESATTQVTARLRGKGHESLAPVKEDDEDGLGEAASRSVASGKRRAIGTVHDTDDEAAHDALQVVARKKGSQAMSAKEKKKVEQEAEAAKNSQFLQIKTGRRKVGSEDAAFNDDFNRLQLRKTQALEAHKMGWNERDVFQEEMAEDAVWAPEDKSTFFQIRYLPMVRQRPAVALDSVAEYDGKKNFKAFRPKTKQMGRQLETIRPIVRAQVALVVDEAPGYGLRESYGQGADDIAVNGHDSDESIELPMAGQTTQRKGKAAAKGKESAPVRSSRSARSKRAVVSESSDEDESRSSTAKEDSAPRITARRAPAKEMITIDSSSDDDDQTRFKGFGTAAKITSRRR